MSADKNYPSTITFFERFEADILSGAKTITIRDASEKNFKVGTTVDVYTLEANRWICQIEIQSVVPVLFNKLDNYHARQENMSLEELQCVIKDIYPSTTELYVISFQLQTECK